MKGFKTILAILRGDAVVLVKQDEHKADVLVGKNVNRQFAVNSMIGAIKQMVL